MSLSDSRVFAIVEQEPYRARDKEWYGEWIDTENPRGDFLFDPNAAHLGHDDHLELRINEQKHRTLLSHPYSLSGDDLRQIVRSLDKWALDVQVTATSAYFPSWTLAVIYQYKKK